MPKIFSLDSTILNTIQSCDLKNHYNFERHITTQTKAKPLEDGSLIHTCLEVYYGLIGGVVEEASDTWRALREAGIYDKIRLLYDLDWASKVRFAIEAGRFTATKMDLEPNDVELDLFQFKEYCEHYQHDGWHPLYVEEVGCKELYADEDLQIIYNFKVDLIAEQGHNVMPWDHKTSKKRSDPSSLSNQFIGYCFGLKKNHIVINKIGFQKTLSRAERFQRFTLTIDNDRIEEWRLNSAYWTILHLAMSENEYEMYIPKLKAIKEKLNHPIMNLTSCDKYSGCIYEEICSKNPQNRESTIDREYKIGQEWDVAKILEVPVSDT